MILGTHAQLSVSRIISSKIITNISVGNDMARIQLDVIYNNILTNCKPTYIYELCHRYSVGINKSADAKKKNSVLPE
jgi:hypothetical protein